MPNVGGNVTAGRLSDAAFQPRNKIDEDGLSLFRFDFITEETLTSTNKHPAGVYCVSVTAGLLREMGMTLLPSPLGDIPGHMVIPEITYSRYRDDQTKNEVKDHMNFLRLIANRRGLWGPTRGPSSVSSE